MKYYHTIIYLDMRRNEKVIETMGTTKLFDLMAKPYVKTLEIQSSAPRQNFRNALKQYNYKNKCHIDTRDVVLVSFL